MLCRMCAREGMLRFGPLASARSGSLFVALAVGSGLVLLLLLGALCLLQGWSGGTVGSGNEQAGRLFLYCAASMRAPMERIAVDYQRISGVTIELQYGGSNTLLSQLELAGQGDLYLAADESYINLARAKALVDESIPLAQMRPVIAVQRERVAEVRDITDLLRPELRVALGNPDQAAIGSMTRSLLERSGNWQRLAVAVRERGVFKPTVNDVANDIEIGSVDAGIIWDATAAQYADLHAVRCPELDVGTARITIAVLRSSSTPAAAMRFARFVAAREHGLRHFHAFGYQALTGDPHGRRGAEP